MNCKDECSVRADTLNSPEANSTAMLLNSNTDNKHLSNICYVLVLC